MDPLTLIFAGIFVVFLATITYKAILNWFRSKHTIAEQDQEAVGVLIAERLDDRQYKTVEGVFRKEGANTRLIQAVYNERTGQVHDARALESNKAPDAETRRELEEGDGMVVYR
jgi:hypothetical protein